jgi:hypothetical protein
MTNLAAKASLYGKIPDMLERCRVCERMLTEQLNKLNNWQKRGPVGKLQMC